MEIIKLKDVDKIYGGNQNEVHALKKINLSIFEGEMVSVVGESGSGKSTLLNIIGGLDTLTGGEYFFKGQKINGLKANKLADFRRRNVGFIVQHFALIDDITVFDNIALPLRYDGMAYIRLEKNVKQLLEQMDISDKCNAYPPQLSGGQCQRVAIARGIACNPSVLLVDEPTGALDERTGMQILEIFKKLNKQGITVVIVTHNTNIANSCKRIIQIKDGVILRQ